MDENPYRAEPQPLAQRDRPAAAPPGLFQRIVSTISLFLGAFAVVVAFGALLTRLAQAGNAPAAPIVAYTPSATVALVGLILLWVGWIVRRTPR